jgi:hypothetical protein
VLHYSGRYKHHVAISKHHMISLDNDQVTFRSGDSGHRNKQRLVPLSLDEFLRRFLLRVLSQAFVGVKEIAQASTLNWLDRSRLRESVNDEP